MDEADFRSRRCKLPPDAFLIGPEREPEPTDLVSHETWRDIVMLPDDVSLRTSEHHGTLLQNASKFVWDWISILLDIQSLLPDPQEDALALACTEATDDFQASIYTMLTGFYRQSISALRTALEEVIAGAYFRAFPDHDKFLQWVGGYREGQLWISQIRKQLKNLEPYSLFEGSEHTLMADGG